MWSESGKIQMIASGVVTWRRSCSRPRCSSCRQLLNTGGSRLRTGQYNVSTKYRDWQRRGKSQCCGFPLVSMRIRIRILFLISMRIRIQGSKTNTDSSGSGFNGVPGSGFRFADPDPDSGGRKWPKNRTNTLKCWMFSYEGWRLLL